MSDQDPKTADADVRGPALVSGEPAPADGEPASRRPRRGALAALVAASRAVAEVDPNQIGPAVEDLSGRRRWLKPLAYAAGTIGIVFEGILILVRDWRLTLLQVVPAVWIWVMSWNLKSHALARESPPVERFGLIAAGVLIAAQAAYWCNATFAAALVSDSRSVRDAFRSVRPRWRLVGGLALLTGLAQGAIWLILPDRSLRWFWIALLVMFIVQIYLFVAVPTWIAGAPKKIGSRRDQMMQKATTGVLGGVASLPGFLFNRIGILIMGIGSAWIVGAALLAVGAVLHVTASSSVRVVKMSVRLRPTTTGTAPPG